MTPGTLVKWTMNGVPLTGRIVANGGGKAQVAANGNTYEVAARELQVVVVCPGCDKPFSRRRVDQHYCSDRCRQRARNVRRAKKEQSTPRLCLQCGEEIRGKNRANKQFCSTKCYRLSRPANRCAACNQPTKSRGATHCRACADAIDRCDTDNLVFAAIVDYKRRHDGNTPSAGELERTALCTKKTVQIAITRLSAAGRIRFQGTGPYRDIIIPGGKWTFEEPTP